MTTAQATLTTQLLLSALLLLLLPCRLTSAQGLLSYQRPPKSNIPGISAVYTGQDPRGVPSALPQLPTFPTDGVRLSKYNPEPLPSQYPTQPQYPPTNTQQYPTQSGYFPSGTSSKYNPKPLASQYPTQPQYPLTNTQQYPTKSGYFPSGTSSSSSSSAGYYNTPKRLTPTQQNRLVRALGLVSASQYPVKSGYDPAPSRDDYYSYDYPKIARQTRQVSFAGNTRYSPSPKVYAKRYPQGKPCHPSKKSQCPGTLQRCVCEDCTHYGCFHFCC